MFTQDIKLPPSQWFAILSLITSAVFKTTTTVLSDSLRQLRKSRPSNLDAFIQLACSKLGQSTTAMQHTAPMRRRPDMQKKNQGHATLQTRSGSARLLRLKHTSTHAHALKLSVCLSGPVSWLQGLWDSPARWQPFLSQAGKTGSGFLCLCASDSYRERASALSIFFFFPSVTAARPRAPICIGVHTRKAREADLQTGRDADR